MFYPLSQLHPIGMGRVSPYGTHPAAHRHTFPPNPAAASVRQRSFIWHDAARDRDVPVRVYLPAGDGPFPAIVFSHGVGESQLSYEYLGRHWAAGGYVSVHPTHAGSDVRITIGRYPVTPILRSAALDPVNWLDRPRDLSFVLDRLMLDGKLSPLIDFDRIAAGGHSLGAHSAMALIGLRFSIDGSPPPDLRDVRIKACIALSPHGPGVLGLGPESWGDIAAPFLSLYGTEDTDIITNDTLSRRAGFDLAAGVEKMLITIEGAEHETFTGRDPAFPFVSDAAKHQSQIATATTAFLNQHLMSTATAKSRRLRGGAAKRNRR